MTVLSVAESYPPTYSTTGDATLLHPSKIETHNLRNNIAQLFLYSILRCFYFVCFVMSSPPADLMACSYCICLEDGRFFDCALTGLVFVATVSSSW